VRASDSVFRFGGGEFVVFATGLSACGGMALGERIWRQIAAGSHDGDCLLTASIGIASCGENAADYDGLFSVADQRLYEANPGGRNRVVGRRVARADEPAQLAEAV
jgi:diguanylate cyclase (GGDEF)-like protein